MSESRRRSTSESTSESKGRSMSESRRKSNNNLLKSTLKSTLKSLTQSASIVQFDDINIVSVSDSSSANIGWLNANASNVGVGNEGSGNVGIGNWGTQNIGTNNTGTSNAGVGNAGDYNIGFSNQGTNNTGIDLINGSAPSGGQSASIVAFSAAFEQDFTSTNPTVLTGFNGASSVLSNTFSANAPSTIPPANCADTLVGDCATLSPISMSQTISVYFRCRGSLKITDLFCAGDSFQVYKDGKLWLTSPIVSPSNDCAAPVDDPEEAFYSPRFSHAIGFLPAGSYKFTIVPLVTAYGGGAVAVKADDFCVLPGEGNYIRF